ncbi:MAG: hypothetical protein KTR18_04030 [Acidiferrobacterales bacterium]|nr:hypothetical protein [Acidiferrobacterales bacterium]
MIIVLTMGRSGSSLIMQSLRHLGIRVAGRAFDTKEGAIAQERHVALNPHGYWEEPGIYYGGPSSVEFQRLYKTAQRPVACKMDIRHFTDENQTQNWLDISNEITSILISYRNPSEQAHSEYIGTIQQESTTDDQLRFQFVTKFLLDYKNQYGGVPKAAKQLNALRHKIYYVNFAGARNPCTYITDLCSMAKIHFTPSQYQSAVSNISLRLYRINQNLLSKEEKCWAIKIGAQDVYLKLSQFNHNLETSAEKRH